MRRAAKVDANQGEVVASLRKIGAVVTSLHRVGQGVADLLVSYRQKWVLLEVKSSAKAKLTPDERLWISSQNAPVYRVNSAEEAVEVVARLAP